MALLFDYYSEIEPDNAVFHCEILHLTYELLKHSQISLAQDINQALIYLKPEINLKKAPLDSQSVDNLLLLNTLGALKIHQIITALVCIGNDYLQAQEPPQKALLQAIKTLIDHWSDFAEWIVQHSLQQKA